MKYGTKKLLKVTFFIASAVVCVHPATANSSTSNSLVIKNAPPLITLAKKGGHHNPCKGDNPPKYCACHKDTPPEWCKLCDSDNPPDMCSE